MQLAALDSAWRADDPIVVDRHRGAARVLATQIGSVSSLATAATYERIEQIGDGNAAGLARIDAALTALGEQSAELRAMLLASRSNLVLFGGGPVGEVEECSREALALARLKRSAPVLLPVLATRAAVLSLSGRVDEAQRICDEYVSAGRAAGRWWSAEAHFDRAYLTRLQAGDRSGYVRDVQFLAQKPSSAYDESRVARLKSNLASLDGRFEDARCSASASARLSRRDVNSAATHFVATFMLCWERGALDDIQLTVREVRDRHPMVVLDAMLAATTAERGQLAEAAPLVAQLATDSFRAAPVGFNWSFIAPMLATAIARLGSAELASVLRDRLEPFAGQLLVAFTGIATMGAADRYLAMLDLTCGDLDAADEPLRRRRRARTQGRSTRTPRSHPNLVGTMPTPTRHSS